ncbi:O-methyl transferase B [Fusarium albosuccineum]|uniref:O-methyl transferase B n=1 Tax=Fusarium albosuccineum TaxID=1237068 RepID=A0A8H4KGA0_9HYPO|nr:O-methyl transferase B [Fusarium albosuccineum]
MQSALSQLKQLSSDMDDTSRRQLMTSLHELAYSMESVDDTMYRFSYLYIQTAVVKVGHDLNIFEHLARATKPVSLREICEKTNGEAALLNRCLSYLASIGAIKQVTKDEYAANRVTENLAEKVAAATICHTFGTLGPQYQALPAFLKKTGYKNPTDELHTVFQDAWGTSKHAFAWIKEHPENLMFFQDYMALRREPEHTWLSAYPIEDETRDWDPKRPVYVNMGGGIGHQCAQFKASFPHVPGRVILQDLSYNMDRALATPGVENMAHNFFEPQPVLGAKFYYLRECLHNHPDHKVRQILRHIKTAMTSDSVLLLDELVLPESGANSTATSLDMTMMVAFAAMERTEAQWRNLLEDVGLRFVHMYTYNPGGYETVMDARLP